jgi:uncharacterized membrane protein YkoI
MSSEEAGMNRRTKIVIGGAAAVVIAGVAAAGVATAADSGVGGVVDGVVDGADVPISGEALEKASAAAIDVAGGGTVVDSEVEDEGGYEVEVNLDDGRQIEVQLDDKFAVVSSEENAEGDDSGQPDD